MTSALSPCCRLEAQAPHGHTPDLHVNLLCTNGRSPCSSLLTRACGVCRVFPEGNPLEIDLDALLAMGPATVDLEPFQPMLMAVRRALEVPEDSSDEQGSSQEEDQEVSNTDGTVAQSE